MLTHRTATLYSSGLIHGEDTLFATTCLATSRLAVQIFPDPDNSDTNDIVSLPKLVYTCDFVVVSLAAWAMERKVDTHMTFDEAIEN